jgi:hypothetical protein
MKEIFSTCSICKCKAKKRKIFLPVKNSTYMNIEDVCVCEDCFQNLPYDLQRKVLYNSQEKQGEDFNLSLIEAMRNTKRRNLNSGYYLFYKNKSGCKFEKFSCEKVLIRNLCKKHFGNHLDFIEAFNNGRLITTIKKS